MAEGKRAGKSGMEKAAEGMTTARSKVAPIIWIIFLLLAGFLVLGAALIALDANIGNAAVEFVINIADSLDLGIFSRSDGIFTFDGKNAQTKGALVNWLLAALVYLIVGKILQRIVEP